MARLMIWGVLCSQLFVLLCMADDTVPAHITERLQVRSNDNESCPSPFDIKNRNWIFTAPAKGRGSEWVGVVMDSDYDYVSKFEKAIFVLTQKTPLKQGFINSCIYATYGGRRLDLRLNIAGVDNKIMKAGETGSWKEPRGSLSSAVLECTDQFRGACNFSLEPNHRTANDLN